MTAVAVEAPEQARQILAKGSKSFALASKLLPASVADDAVVLYAYCRRADDEVDLAPPAEQPQRLRALQSELDRVYSQARPEEPVTAALQDVVRGCAIPRLYLDELLAGMQMDVDGATYPDFASLVTYAHRVAGVVGLMMCHIMRVRRDASLVHAAHLGIALQLTNIARDVLEDWERGRLYLPDDMLRDQGLGHLRGELGGPFPRAAAPGVARATAALLDRAAAYYASGDAGMSDLSLRCGLAIRTARLIYDQVGVRARAQGCDPLAPRAIVPGWQKLALLVRAAVATGLGAPFAWLRPIPQIPRAGLPSGKLLL